MPFNRSVELVGAVSSGLGEGFVVLVGMFLLFSIGGMIVYCLEKR